MMQIWDTKGLQLTASGIGAPSGDQLISAEWTYGGAGSCQSGTVRPIDTTAQGRDSEWLLSLSGHGPVFRGIPDGISDGDNQLAQVSLMPSHRPRLDGLGTSLAGIQAGPYETLSAVLQRQIGNEPGADIGICADGTEVAYVPQYGDGYTLDSRAYDFRYIGPTYPDAVTDAVFDPGEGWRKYVYQRAVPPYALRRTAAATADPPIISKIDTPHLVIRVSAPVPPVTNNGVTHRYNNIIECDNVERIYAENDSTETEILSDVATYSTGTPPDTDVRRATKIRIRCPFFVGGIGPYPLPVKAVYVPLTGGTPLTPIIGGVGNPLTINPPSNIALPPAPLPASPTPAQVAAKVDEQNAYLAAVKAQSDAINNSLASAKTDLTHLVQRVDALGANTTDANGNLTNLATEIEAVKTKLNGLGNSVVKLDSGQRTPRNTPKSGELKLLISLVLANNATGVETVLNTSSHSFTEQDIGLELALAFEVTENLSAGVSLLVRYELVTQDTGKALTITFRPLDVAVDYDTPNVDAVQMPEGWGKPFRTEPRFEFRLPGIHMPPLRINGLPGGYSQMAAGATVTWHRGEASTLITTAAWGYG